MTEPLCGARKPVGTTTCIERAGHNGSHGDGSVIRWIYRGEHPMTCPYCHETNAHAQDCLATLISEATR